jgi:hypothetical protein
MKKLQFQNNVTVHILTDYEIWLGYAKDKPKRKPKIIGLNKNGIPIERMARV